MIIVGEALVDLVQEEDGRLDPRSGGSARNVALAAARLGGDVRYVTGLSTDAFGQQLRRELEAEGVDLSFCIEVDDPTPLAVVTLDDEGVAQYAFHLADTAVLALHGDDLASLPGDESLHVSLGAVTLATPQVGDALVALLASHDALTSLDPNVRPAFLRDGDDERLDAAVSLVDLVRCSDEDLQVLHPDREPEDVARSWLDAGAGAVVVTRGPDGAVAWTPDGEVTSRVEAVGATVDTVGAGDTFGAALLVTLAEQGVTTREALVAMTAEDWQAALDVAGRAAAVVVTRRGADPPRRDEL